MTRKFLALLACCFAFSVCSDFYAKETDAEKEKRRQERKAQREKEKKEKERQQNRSGSSFGGSSITKSTGMRPKLGGGTGAGGAASGGAVDINICGTGHNSSKPPYEGCTISPERLAGQQRRLAGKHWAFDNPRPTGGWEPRFDGFIEGANGILMPLKPEYKKGPDGHFIYRTNPRTGEEYPVQLARNCWMENQGGPEETRAFKLLVFFPTTHGKFTYHEFTFKPRRAGKVIFQFGFIGPGNSYPVEDPPDVFPKHPVIPYDNPGFAWWGIAHMEVTGAKLKNTEFDAKGMGAWGVTFAHTKLDPPEPKFKLVNDRNVKDMIEEGKGRTPDQKDLPCQYWLRNHQRLSQVFEVEKDVPVTISFYTTALDTIDTLH